MDGPAQERPTEMYDFRTVPASTAVVETVAAREGVDVAAVSEPLGDAIDPDALDALLASLAARDESGEAQFVFAGYDVTVHADGRIDLAPRA